MSEEYYLPFQTAERINAGYDRCKNLGLILDKYTPRRVLDKRDGDEKSNAARSEWLKGFVSNNHIDPQLRQSVTQRWQAALTAMQAQQFTATTDWRMVVGLGGETVLETDLTLHHVYGIPFIPGSALKGLTRAYVTSEEKEYKPKKSKKGNVEIEEDSAEVQRIFGTQEIAGSVIFFDALPNGDVTIALDIMNAHYPKYYGEKQLPTNNQNPNPITFLTVTNTTFLFGLAPRLPQDEKSRSDVALAKTWLQEALQKYGVGGKTSAGYGYFTVVEQTSKANSVHQQQIETPNPELPIVAGYIRELNSIGSKDISGRIQGYYQRWQKITLNEARVTFAKAIVERARQGVKEGELAKKGWYKELREFLDKAEI